MVQTCKMPPHFRLQHLKMRCGFLSSSSTEFPFGVVRVLEPWFDGSLLASTLELASWLP